MEIDTKTMIPVERLRILADMAGDNEGVPLAAIIFLAVEQKPTEADIKWIQEVSKSIEESREKD